MIRNVGENRFTIMIKNTGMPVLALLCIFTEFLSLSSHLFPVMENSPSCRTPSKAQTHFQALSLGCLSTVIRKKVSNAHCHLQSAARSWRCNKLHPYSWLWCHRTSTAFLRDCSGVSQRYHFPIKFGWLHLTGFKTEASTEP